MIPLTRKPDDERKPDTAASGNTEQTPARQRPAEPPTTHDNENQKRARKRRPKFVL
jgi:hypothetical protein